MHDTLDRHSIRAISAETRQDIIKALSKRPYTASELAHGLNKHVTTVAEHLHVLERNELVRKRQSTNKWIYYELTEKGLKLTKPAYSWIVTLALAILSFGVGLYEIFFVRFTATKYSISEAAMAASTTEMGSDNVYIGIIAVAVALLLLWYSVKSRNEN